MSETNLTHPSPDRLAAYPLGQLDAAEAATVAAHLAECPACRSVLDSLPPETLHSLAKGSTGSFHPEAPPGSQAKAAARPAAEAPPKQFGPYQITKLLGRGGMGSVYLAHDPRLDRPVALKVPHFADTDSSYVVERFYREARAAARIEHPNICQVYEVGEHGGKPYLAMRYVEGRSLSSVIKDGKPLGQRQAAGLVGKLALALQVAHAAGVIHRDLKPSNVMLLKGREPIIMDFGLARQVDRTDARLTKSGAVMGTPAYMAPEQASGDPDAVGPVSDVYSLGVILYELLTGRLPFEGPVAVVLALILVKEPERPSAHRPDLDPHLEAICLKAMAKKPEDRYATMGELAAALSAFLRGEGAAPATAVPSGARTSFPVPGAAGHKAVETQAAYQVAADEAAPPAAPVERPAREGHDSHKGEGRRPPRKKGKARRPQPAAGKLWLVLGGALAGLVILIGGAAVLAFVWGRHPEKQVAVVPPEATTPRNVPTTEKATTEKAAPPPSTEKATPPGPPPGAGPAANPKNTEPPAQAAPDPGQFPPGGQPYGPGMPVPGAMQKRPPRTGTTPRGNAFTMRVVQSGRATSTHTELKGKSLTGVIVEVTSSAFSELPIDASSVTLLTSAGKEVPALLVFLPNGRQGEMSVRRYGPTVTRPPTSGPWLIKVGQEPYHFDDSASIRPGDWNFQPSFLQGGSSIFYGFPANAPVKVGFLFESDATQSAGVRVAGRELALNAGAPEDTAGGPGKTGPPGEAKPKPAGPEVYRFAVAGNLAGAESCNITVTETPAGLFAIGRGNNSGVGYVSKAMNATGIQLLPNGIDCRLGIEVLAQFQGFRTYVPDAPGSTHLWIVVDPKVGHVTVAGLTFKGKGDIGVIQEIRKKDGILIMSKAGIRATDEEGIEFVSQDRVPLDGIPKTVMVKVPKK